MKPNRYILVDTENVGRDIPQSPSEKTAIYYFVQNSVIAELLITEITKTYGCLPELFKVLSIEDYEHKANCMDMCITRTALDIALCNNNVQIDIISNDKGFDDFIKYMQKSSTTNKFIRMKKFPDFAEEKFREESFKKLPACCNCYRKEVLTIAARCNSMTMLWEKLSKRQRRSIYINNYMNEISGANIQMEYDIYKKTYNIYQNGNREVVLYTSKNGKEAKKEFNKRKKDLEKAAKPYKTTQNYKAIKALKALKIVNKGIEKDKLSEDYLKQNLKAEVANQVAALLALE